MPQLDTTWYVSQLFWLCVCFFTMLFIMSKIFIPQIAKIMNLRQRKIDDYLIQAGEIKEQAEQSLLRYQEALNAANKEASASLEECKKEMNDYISQTQDELAARLNKKISEGEALIEQNKKEALKEIQSLAENLALDITKKIGLKDIKASDIKSAVKKAAND